MIEESSQESIYTTEDIKSVYASVEMNEEELYAVVDQLYASVLHLEN